ncbi:MAG: hypothetical protein ACMUEL_08070 [Flavobacteriales bacterium Tduv]
MGSRTYFWQKKRWFGSGKDRYKGLARVHDQLLMKDMAHNLYRSLGIIMHCP